MPDASGPALALDGVPRSDVGVSPATDGKRHAVFATPPDLQVERACPVPYRPAMPNPALSDLAVLVGEWRVELTNARFLDDGATMTGALAVEWLDDAFLVLRSSMDEDGGPPASVAVVGRNEARDDDELLHHDERGVSRILRMTFAGSRWTQHREDPGFHQHLEGSLEPGGDRITGTWSTSHDGGSTWEHDVDLTYIRV